MPWMREGKCVFKQNADGSKGASAGCSDTPEMAKKHMRSLYAQSETAAKKKAVMVEDDVDAMEDAGESAAEETQEDDLCAIFPLGAQPEIVRIQDILRGMIPDATFLSPEDFHITAVLVDGGDLELLQQTLSYQYDFPAIALVADSIGMFETPDGYAIYINVRWNSDLIYMQRRLFYAMVGDGNMVSSFSLPDWWTPHITLGYSKTPIKTFDLTPFAVMVSAIEVCDASHEPVVEAKLKSDSLEFKAFDLEVIAKGVVFNDEGDLIIPVMANPFTGPVKGVADYEGDYFHKGTRFGNAKEVLAFWDHGRDERYLVKELKAQGLDDDDIAALGPDFGFGKSDIGVAVKGDTTEDGIIYNVIVNRNTKYKHALARAAREGKIGASGEYKYFEYDKNVPGKVDKAPMVGLALTPSPFNTDAVVLKSNPLEGEMAVIAKEKKVEVPAEGSKPVVEAHVTPEVSAKVSLTDTLKAKSAEIDKAANAEEASEDAEATTISLDDFKAMRTEIAELKAVNLELKTASTESQTRLSDFIEDLKTALPALSEMIAKAVILEINGTVKEHVQKSRLELETDSLFSKNGSNNTNGIQKSAGGTSKLRHAHTAEMTGYPGAN